MEEEIISNSYNVHLENFDGPIDLLLHLIKEAKMDIQNIKLAEITESYLNYIKDIKNLDIENASEFITIAATLIEIKSRTLLPKEPIPDENIEQEEKLLIARIQEREILKDSWKDLQNIENIKKMYKAPDKQADNVRIILKDMVLDNLLDAFAKMLAKVDRKQIEQEEKKILKDRFTVAEKILEIKSIMQDAKSMYFSELFNDDNTKGEVINTFLAMLELLKLQIIRIEQPDIFGEIKIFAIEGENK